MRALENSDEVGIAEVIVEMLPELQQLSVEQVPLARMHLDTVCRRQTAMWLASCLPRVTDTIYVWRTSACPR